MDPSADAEAFLLGLEKAGDAGTTEGQSQPSAELNHTGTEQMNGQVSDGLGNGTAGPAANGYTSSGRRNKWGSVMEVKEEPPKPQKKRRSRWEEVPEENTDTTLAVVPKEITICGGIRVSILMPMRLPSTLSAPFLHWTGFQDRMLARMLAIVAITSCTLHPVGAWSSFGTGMQVYLPSALTGGPQSSDPKVRELNLEIPPEGERSPSPEPIYDRNGMYSWRSCPPPLH